VGAWPASVSRLAPSACLGERPVLRGHDAGLGSMIGAGRPRRLERRSLPSGSRTALGAGQVLHAWAQEWFAHHSVRQRSCHGCRRRLAGALSFGDVVYSVVAGADAHFSALVWCAKKRMALWRGKEVLESLYRWALQPATC